MDFSLPIRVRWDIHLKGRSGRTKRIARQIREISPLFVELKVAGEKGINELPSIFSELHKGNPRIEATVELTPGAASVARRGYPVDFIWDVKANEPFGSLLPGEAKDISFVPDEDTLDDLPEILEEFSDSGAGTLRLANVNAVRALAEKGHIPIPRAEQLREVAEKMAAHPVSLEGKRLVVHDFFLWKMLRESFPRETGERVEFNGCQAASALVFIDWEGNVYPCDSLPIRLGNLLETPLDTIWRSPSRERVLSAIRSMPAFCKPCDHLSGCLSGCRGPAFSASGSLDSPDP